MTTTERATLEAKVDQLKAEGLVDMKFYTGEVSEATPESFCKEVNELLKAVDEGKVVEFKFGDSTHVS